jgi:acyl-CoA thioester hydrolase
MLGAVTEERIRVRYGETDQMGHAYYANYLYWFEQARGAWCRDRGFTYKSLEDKGYLLPVVEANVRYRDEVRYDDWVCVRVRLTEIKRSAMRFDYEVFNETTGRATSEGFTWHVLMGESRKARAIPEEMLELLNRDPAAHPRLE